MLGKITDATPSVRRNTVLYLVGRAAVLAAVLLTLADIVRVYMAYGTEIAIGMMIPAWAPYWDSAVPALPACCAWPSPFCL